MISYLPEIYPDELVYSWFCRYYVHSGYIAHKMALEDILVKSRKMLSKEFLGKLNPDMKKKIQEIYPIKQLILEHTMFPQYARFIPLEKRKDALHHIAYDCRDNSSLFSVMSRAESDGYLKYCPLCAEEDRQKYGETYWHRSHQIRNMRICIKHNCMLESSLVSAKSEMSSRFYPAEEAVKSDVRYINNAALKSYAIYLTDIFNAPLDFKNDIPAGAVLYRAMKAAQYIRSTGKSRFTQRLTDDMNGFYEEIGLSDIAAFYQIQNALRGKTFDFSVICQIAFFLGIGVEELIHPKITNEQLEAEQALHKKEKNITDWKTLDDELSPVLERFAKGVYTGELNKNGRPGRVTMRLLDSELNLSRHRFKKLPKCRAIFEQYTESSAENQTRRAVWAYNKLKSEGKKHIGSTDIGRLAGLIRNI